MAIVRNQSVDPTGRPVPVVTVVAELVTGSASAGYTADSTVIHRARVDADSAGRWELDLTPNSAITPASTHYRIVERSTWGTYLHTVVVPAGGPFHLINVLAVPPPPGAPLVPIGGVHGVTAVDERTGAVTLTDRYSGVEHDHDGRYASPLHVHDDRYPPRDHDHDARYDPRYAAILHAHLEYALTGHRHDDRYPQLDHHHDLRYDPRYAALVHAHLEYALTGHLHDDRYSGLGHDHDARYDPKYAPTVHDHDVRYDARYSVLAHTHAGFAPLVHDHDVRYDGRYSALGHLHDTRYSALAHDHDARYDLRYAPIVHRHDELYSVLGHGHDAAAINTGVLERARLPAVTLAQRPVPGRWAIVPPVGTVTASVTMAVGEVVLAPFLVGASFVADLFSVDVGASAVGASLRLLIYGSNPVLQPGALVLDLGLQDAITNGAKTWTPPGGTFVFAPGVWWLGLLAQGAAPGVRGAATWHPLVMTDVAPTGTGTASGYGQSGVGTVPPAMFIGTTPRTAPRVAVRAA